ncbi:MAG: hypothetical protein G8345_06970 [Magnetococcales bacterium]|nr:hypothetical protein [Magnetococcales bacterium]NGZ26614.1 hypothetical protein [Magnetococcales bacterium]
MRVWTLPLAAVLLSLLFSLAIAEVVIRLVIGAPMQEQFPLLEVVPDRELGFFMVPGSFHYTYQVPVQLNDLGFRGPQVSAEKPVGEVRLLALGDSHVYGQGVADEDLMTTRLESLLQQANPSCRIRVINLGVRGYSINQEAALIKNLAPRLAGQRVLFFPYLNDFDPVDIGRRFRYHHYFDRYVFDLTDKAEGDALAKWQWRQIFRHSALLMWGHDMVELYRSRDHLENRILQGVKDEEVVAIRQKVGGHLQELARWSDAYGLPVTVIPVPAAPQLVRDFPNELYQSFFREWAERLNWHYADPLPVMRQQSKQLGRLPVLPYDGHYDAHGQKALAVAVAEHLGQGGFSCPEEAVR